MKPVFKSRENQRYVVDGKEVWESRSTAVGAVIFAVDKDNKIYVLVEKRSNKMPEGAGLWAVPSGYLNYDEDAWDAMRRELYEETSFFVDDYKKQLVFDNNEEPLFTFTKPLENRQNVILWFCLIYDFSEISLPKDIESYKDSEIDAIKWMPIEDVFSNKYKWAFKHDERVRNALNKIDIISK